jgi:hypothetical protein
MEDIRLYDFVKSLWMANSSDEIRTILNQYEVELRQPPISGSLQDRLFELANDFAVAKQGDVAVKLHAIHNELP